MTLSAPVHATEFTRFNETVSSRRKQNIFEGSTTDRYAILHRNIRAPCPDNIHKKKCFNELKWRSERNKIF